MEIDKDLNLSLLVLENIVKNMPGHVYWKDEKGIYLGCNDRQAQSLGLQSGSEVVGKTDFDLPWSSHKSAQEFRENDLRIMNNRAAEVIEETAQIDGKLATVLSIKAPLEDLTGKIYGILGISIDITTQKKLTEDLLFAKEQAETANLLKSQLISLLGDELRAPLITILAQAQRLASHVPLGQKRKLAETIIDESNVLQNLVNDIIDFSEGSIEKNRLHKPIYFDLKRFLEDIIAAHQWRAQQRDILLMLEYPDGTPAWIHSDKLGWRKVINYLLTHAIEASKRTEIHISVDNVKQSQVLELDLTMQSKGDLINQVATLIDTSGQNPILTPKEPSSLVGLDLIKQLVLLLGGQLYIEQHSADGLKIVCSLKVAFNRNPPIFNNPWSIYQEQVKILMIDNGNRGQVIRQHLGRDNIEIVAIKEDALNVLRAAIAIKKPFLIVIIGGLHRGQYQQRMTYNLAKTIVAEKNIDQPMLVLLSDDNSIEQLNLANQAGFYLVINPSIAPTELQTELTAAWETWCEEKELRGENGTKILKE